MGERLARRDIAFEGQEHRPHRVLQTAVGDDHVEDRLRVVGDPLPDPMVSNSRRAAATIAEARASAGARPSAGSATVTANERPEPLAERDRQREAGKTGAADQHVDCSLAATHSDAMTASGRHYSIVTRRECGHPSRARVDGGRGRERAACPPPCKTCWTSSTLEQLELNLFRGRSPQVGWQRVFGGQVIGQALVAACRTVDVAGRPPHSLHAYFMLGGDPKVPIIYEIDRIRDGKSFTTRRVVAIQHGQAIFTMAVSFHRNEPGIEHQARMPDVPKPEELPSEAELKERVLPMMPDPVRRYYERERPIELRPVEFDRYLGKKLDNGNFHIWIRTTGAAAGRAGDPPMRAGLCVRHDAARHRADPARPHACSTRPSWRRASIMRSGFTGRSAPTSGCSTPRTVPTWRARAAFRAASSSRATARWSPRWRRRACCASGASRA